MQTYRLNEAGSLDGIVLRHEADPEPRPTEIVVRVRAASVNRRDAFILNGAYPLAAKKDLWSAVAGSEAVHAGQTVLTLGTGGVALFALQFAKLMGCMVIAATSRDTKADRLRALGADHVINHAATPEWAGAVRDITGGRGVDLIVETVGPKTIGQSLAAASLYGRIVLLSVKDAEHAELVLPGKVYARTMATLSRAFVGSRARLEAMSEAIAAHRLRPVIDRVLPFAEAPEAYRHFMGGDLFGKVVIQGA